MTDARVTFAESDELTFVDNPSPVTFAVDRERRTIRGLAVPFGDIGDNGWAKWSFSKGTLTWGKAKALDNHDRHRAFGTVTFTEEADGIHFAMRVAAGARGDEMLSLAAPDPETGEAAYDGVSVGLGNDVAFTERDGVRHVTAASLIEASLTPFPAFGRASVTSVAASANQKGNTVKCSKCNTIHAEGVVSCAAPVSFSADEGATLAATVKALDDKVKAMETIRVPVAELSTFAVREEPIYRFSGTTPAPSGHDFASDLYAASMRGDDAAAARLTTFTTERLGAQFATDTADVNEVNPPTYRPDMFLGQAPVPSSPMYDTFRKGGLANVTPFFYSKLDRAGTTVAVATHVEGTDPTATDLLTAVGATITPSAVSGKVHLTREVGDQGGNPQVSGLIWNEFERSFSIALETKTVALLTAAAGSVTSLTGAIAPGANGAVAGLAIESGLLGLQFLPDGSRFTKAFGHVDLYTALATYENADGEKRYPIINPQNRSGIAGARYSFLDIAGYRMEPGTSLGATSANASNSWVADPNAVHVWNSGLTRFDKLQETVEGWDVGCFAYFAGIVYDASGLRKIAYDPAA